MTLEDLEKCLQKGNFDPFSLSDQTKKDLYWESCAQGKLELVKYFISIGVPVDTRDPNRGRTGLYIAAKHGYYAIVKWLFENAKANPEAKSLQGATPLFIAAQEGHLELVKYFVSIGCDFKTLDFGISPFYSSCQNGRLDVAKFIFSLGIDINQREFEGNTAMLSCCFQGQLNVLEYLHSIGANDRIQNEEGLDGLFYAAQFGHLKCLKFLLSIRKINRKVIGNVINENFQEQESTSIVEEDECLNSTCLVSAALANVEMVREIFKFAEGTTLLNQKKTIFTAGLRADSLEMLKFLIFEIKIDPDIANQNPDDLFNFFETVRFLASLKPKLKFERPDKTFAFSDSHIANFKFWNSVYLKVFGMRNALRICRVMGLKNQSTKLTMRSEVIFRLIIRQLLGELTTPYEIETFYKVALDRKSMSHFDYSPKIISDVIISLQQNYFNALTKK